MQILLLITGLFAFNFYNIASAAEGVSLDELMRQIEALKAEQDSLKVQMGENKEKMMMMESELERLRSVAPKPEVARAEEKVPAALPPAKKERMEKRIERLEEMAGKMFLLEPVEEIKKVREWVCPEGHIYDHPGPDNKCHICGKPQTERLAYRKYKYARKESISDLIGGMLEEEFKKRVAVGMSATGIMQQSINSDKKDTSSAQGSFDIFFLHRPMFNSTLFVDLEAIGGSGPDFFSGSASGLNDDASRGSTQDADGVDRVSVREAWLQSIFAQDRLRLVAGKIDLTNYFDMNTLANDETTQFLSGAFVNNLVLSPPDNGPGLVGYFDTKKGYSFGLGLQSADNSGTAVTDNVYVIGEVDYYAPRFLFGLGGNYRLWGRYNGDTRSRAVGLSLDQQLTQRLTAFGRYGITGHTVPGEGEWTWSLGLGMRSPFSSRRYDHTALAFSQLKKRDGEKEDLAEAYYSFFLTDHMNLSVNSQVVLNSGSDDPVDEDYLATFGLRVQMDF
ncbi:MAG: carbohydrate porin [Candidatus Brocadiales bacterium]